MKKSFQAKHVDEAAILRMLLANLGKWHTHWDGFKPYDWTNPSAAGPLFLGPLEYPDKVIRAKLGSMVRRGLIDGCDCGCRGDWHIEERTYRNEKTQMRDRAAARLLELEAMEAGR